MDTVIEILKWVMLILLAGYVSLYRGFWALLYTWGESRGLAGTWWGPVLWVSLEMVQTYMISGFPWMLLGYGFHQSPYLIQVVDITGVYGLSFLFLGSGPPPQPFPACGPDTGSDALGCSAWL